MEKFSITLRNLILQDEMAFDDFNISMMESAKDSRMHNDLQIRMNLPRYMENNRREETVEENGV